MPDATSSVPWGTVVLDLRAIDAEAIRHIMSSSYTDDLNGLAEEIWQTAEEHGFHEPLPESVRDYAEDAWNEIGQYLVEFEADRKGQEVADTSGLYLNLTDAQQTLLVRLLLVMTEAYEVLEAAVTDPDHEAEEVADTLIRVLHYARERNIDIDKAVRDKMDKNKNRPYKHGKKF